MRIGINIPNELMKRIEPFRSEINLSQVCREAIERLVKNDLRIKERVTSDGMDEHAMRLGNPPLIEPDWVGYALDDARDWVMAVDLEDWDDFFYRHDDLKAQGKDVNFLAGFPLQGVKNFYDWSREHESWFRQQFKTNHNSDTYQRAREKYACAWLKYVNEVRQKQLQHFKDMRKEALAERKQALQERPEPEVPLHLLS